MKKNEGHEQAQSQVTEPAAEAGSNAWWEARLAAIAGGRESTRADDDWTRDFAGTTTTIADDGITTSTLETNTP